MNDLNFCIDAMQSCLALGRKALQVEISIGLYVFHTYGHAEIAARKTFRGVYASAGEMDCLTADGASYKTVSRRIDRIARLYELIGYKRVKTVVNGTKGPASLEALRLLIEPLALHSMDALADHVGVEVRRAPAELGALDRRASDGAGFSHLATTHIRLDIPPEAEPGEILDLIDQLRAMLVKRTD